jgi:hypothetical protein
LRLDLGDYDMSDDEVAEAVEEMVGSQEGKCGTESDVDSLFEDSSDNGSSEGGIEGEGEGVEESEGGDAGQWERGSSSMSEDEGDEPSESPINSPPNKKKKGCA